MKKLAFLLSILLLAVAVNATPILVGGAPLVVNNTSVNCSNTVAFASNPSLQQFAITHGPLGGTNDITLTVSNSLDGVNFTQPYVWHPQYTNATTEYIYSGSIFVTNYCRATVTTTNSQSVIINYGQ